MIPMGIMLGLLVLLFGVREFTGTVANANRTAAVTALLEDQ